ncbi:universal stress protein [Algibacter amylolyticus]|uniref:Universal stress protein n=1 Tax=Algibacter amylolyticus TaxID=1608400 RepID=A0A5M7B9X6_9FLAO|nr:universal stress protein [Algibacter amylolyticus]KAA5826242.1 universal stress protein [Algibacter amylolyticus]MBB5268444.1 nucleotide-binding universal stress UspA family protein [Algibacter amylolyticus]TSJ80280.1 universal stress protein [Algibacter amylolyticus]
MNVLLPTDFSENSWNAISYAIAFFENTECNFYLLHVNRIEGMVASAENYITTEDVIEEIYTKPSRTKLRQQLKQVRENHKVSKNHRFYTLTENYFFLEAIRKHVEEKKIDMIVMGTKGASGLSKFIVGSNTGDVITKVKCTTLVVPECAKYNKLQEVAFTSDFNLTYDLNILQPLTNVLKDTKGNLRVIHIQNKDTTLNPEQLNNKELLNDYFEEFNPSFHFLTNKNVEDAIECFVESRSVDMIAMVAKNLNYFQNILFHSKVEKITYHTDIPFLVLHE